MRLRRRILISVLLFLVALLAAGVIAFHSAVGTFAIAIPESAKGNEPGALVAVERISKYPAFVAQFLLDSVKLPEPIHLTYGITLYRVTYRTTNHDGSLVVASGLVALPNEHEPDRVVLYHHGTIVERRTAPSQSRVSDGVLVAVATAGTGGILVAPDYIGLGESRAMHPYMYAKTTSSTSIDFLHAARALVRHLKGEWPPSLYLMGFSQGGHATFAVQRDLEKSHDPQFEVQAAAPIAGPFRLREISFPQALLGKTTSDPLYVAYIANSYAQVYHRPLKSIVAAPYAEIVPSLFDGDHTIQEIEAALPTDPRKVFNAEFLDAYDKAKPHWFLDALKENDVDAWTPVAPVRIFYGDDDVDVPPEEARRVEADMKRRGADVTAISVGPCNHWESSLRAIPQATRWFEELASKKPAG